MAVVPSQVPTNVFRQTPTLSESFLLLFLLIYCAYNRSIFPLVHTLLYKRYALLSSDDYKLYMWTKKVSRALLVLESYTAGRNVKQAATARSKKTESFKTIMMYFYMHQ